MKQQEIDAIAERIRAGGTPDFLNRWVGMTPETLAANEEARKRQIVNMERRTAMPTMGPKEQALKQLRNQRDKPFTEEPDMPRTTKTSAPAQPAKAAAAPAAPKKPAVAKTTAKTAKSKTKASARSRTPVVDPNAPTKAVRPGSKMETIRGLLTRRNGCTAAEIKESCNWPSVSVPQQAKSLGITLHKHKGEDGVTRYADHALA